MGFRLIITRQNASAPLVEHTCVEPMISVGSDPAATIHLNGSGVAAEQVIILREEDGLLLINRAEGTLLNDEPLNREARHPLALGDTLRFAAYVVTLRNESEYNAMLAELADEMPQTLPFDEPRSNVSAPPALIAEPSRETKKFASILDSLRTEEDSFYFLFETGSQAGARLLIDRTETLCGWDANGTQLSIDPAIIETECMVVRKDWTGVIVHSPLGKKAMLRVNDEPLSDPRRLRNGDRLKLAAPSHAPPTLLVFHEPASLVALDTLLPQPLPPPVALARPGDPDASALELLPPEHPPPGRWQFDWEHRYFGYFNLLELCIMAAGTLVAAVIIFLVLQYA